MRAVEVRLGLPTVADLPGFDISDEGNEPGSSWPTGGNSTIHKVAKGGPSDRVTQVVRGEAPPTVRGLDLGVADSHAECSMVKGGGRPPLHSHKDVSMVGGKVSSSRDRHPGLRGAGGEEGGRNECPVAPVKGARVVAEGEIPTGRVKAAESVTEAQGGHQSGEGCGSLRATLSRGTVGTPRVSSGVKGIVAVGEEDNVDALGEVDAERGGRVREKGSNSAGEGLKGGSLVTVRSRVCVETDEQSIQAVDTHASDEAAATRVSMKESVVGGGNA